MLMQALLKWVMGWKKISVKRSSSFCFQDEIINLAGTEWKIRELVDNWDVSSKNVPLIGDAPRYSLQCRELLRGPNYKQLWRGTAAEAQRGADGHPKSKWQPTFSSFQQAVSANGAVSTARKSNNNGKRVIFCQPLCRPINTSQRVCVSVCVCRCVGLYQCLISYFGNASSHCSRLTTAIKLAATKRAKFARRHRFVWIRPIAIRCSSN